MVRTCPQGGRGDLTAGAPLIHFQEGRRSGRAPGPFPLTARFAIPAGLPGGRARRTSAPWRAALVTPTIKELRAGGTTSLRALALALNAKGIPAPRGGKWYASSVRNALALAS